MTTHFFITAQNGYSWLKLAMVRCHIDIRCSSWYGTVQYCRTTPRTGLSLLSTALCFEHWLVLILKGRHQNIEFAVILFDFRRKRHFLWFFYRHYELYRAKQACSKWLFERKPQNIKGQQVVGIILFHDLMKQAH